MEVRLLQKGIMARKDNKVKDRIDEVGDLLSKLTSAVRSFTWRNNKLPGFPLSFSLPPSYMFSFEILIFSLSSDRAGTSRFGILVKNHVECTDRRPERMER